MLLSGGSFAQDSYTILKPEIIVQRVPAEFQIIFPENSPYYKYTGELEVLIDGDIRSIIVDEGHAKMQTSFDKKGELILSIDNQESRIPVNPIPLWMSVLPPLIAILMALIIREVFSALFLGLLIGGVIISAYSGYSIFISLFKGIFLIVDTYIIESLLNTGHLSIIIFSMMIGAMVTLITQNGGMKGVINILSRYASKPRSGQFITWLLGILIFFDDYANTLVVGNTMRPVTDRLRISREKLAYIVDSTAAPVASVALVTTWIGAELSYIQDGLDVIGLNESAYNIFLNSLLYSFYPVFALALILILVYRNVDYGPMFRAEKKARLEGIKYESYIAENTSQVPDMEAREGIRPRWYNAVVPVFIVITGTFAGLIYTGWDPQVWSDQSTGIGGKLSATIGNSDSYRALLWSSLAGVLTAILLTVGQRLMSLKESIEGLMSGFKTMLTAVLILTLAWAIALMTEHLHTAVFISEGKLQLSISPYIIPAITFILAALVAFSTGSSWGTMAILYPLLLPSTWLITSESGLDYQASMAIFYNVVSAVLAGSVLGDHCSPISDTTILSSLASSCNHIEHVRTQLPYAITAGAVAIFAGTLPAAYGVHPAILFPLGIILLIGITYLFGRRNPQIPEN